MSASLHPEDRDFLAPPSPLQWASPASIPASPQAVKHPKKPICHSEVTKGNEPWASTAHFFEARSTNASERAKSLRPRLQLSRKLLDAQSSPAVKVSGKKKVTPISAVAAKKKPTSQDRTKVLKGLNQRTKKEGTGHQSSIKKCSSKDCRDERGDLRKKIIALQKQVDLLLQAQDEADGSDDKNTQDVLSDAGSVASSSSDIASSSSSSNWC